MTDKPKILWLADDAGWAYDAIFQNQSRRLPHFSHKVFYMMRKEHEWSDWVELGSLIEIADIIVAMHLMYFVEVKEIAGAKCVALLTGPRIFE